jgi:hypothetical protein
MGKFALPPLVAASAPEIVPRTALLKVIERPLSAVKSEAGTGDPEDGVKKQFSPETWVTLFGIGHDGPLTTDY